MKRGEFGSTPAKTSLGAVTAAMTSSSGDRAGPATSFMRLSNEATGICFSGPGAEPRIAVIMFLLRTEQARNWSAMSPIQRSGDAVGELSMDSGQSSQSDVHTSIQSGADELQMNATLTRR
jgi:hypothetical protein